MRINVYNTQLNEDMHTILIKEKSLNYPIESSLCMPMRIVKVMNEVFSLNKQAEECIYMIAFNTKLKPLAFFLISKGTVNASIISPREILIRNLLSGSANFVLVHNHPSTDTTPSVEDTLVTKRVKEASELVGIKLLDHIIIGGESYMSFKEENIL